MKKLSVIGGLRRPCHVRSLFLTLIATSMLLFPMAAQQGHADEVGDKLGEVEAALQLGETNRAITMMSIAKLHASLKWEKNDPKQAYLTIMEADIEVKRDQFDKAAALYQQVIDQKENADQLFIPVMQAYLGMARLSYRKQDISNARSWSAKARQYSKSDILARKTLSLAYDAVYEKWRGFIRNFGDETHQLPPIRVRGLNDLGQMKQEWQVDLTIAKLAAYETAAFDVDTSQLDADIVEIALDFIE